jgi:hypothetical protein
VNQPLQNHIAANHQRGRGAVGRLGVNISIQPSSELMMVSLPLLAAYAMASSRFCGCPRLLIS